MYYSSWVTFPAFSDQCAAKSAVYFWKIVGFFFYIISSTQSRVLVVLMT